MTTGPYVRLYGGPLIEVEGARPSLTPAQRRLLGIVYLDAPDPVSREEVSWLLWETGESADTRHRIRQLLYGINKDAPTPVIEREGDLLVPCLPTDADHIEPSLSPPLRLVTSAGTTAFEHWLDTARDRLTRRRVNRLAAALDAAASARDLQATKEAASALLVVHPDEAPPEVVVDLAWALQGMGRHREAAFALREATDRQLDAADDMLTGALDSVLLAQAIEQARPLAPITTPLCGRDDALRRVLSQLIDTDSNGIVLFGPTAIGKSSVLKAVEQELTIRFPGHVVLSSFEDWTFGARPFGLIESLLADPSFVRYLATNPEEFPPTLATALPHLAAECGIRQPSRAIDPEPRIISRQLRQLLHDLWEDRPAVVIADNLGSADPSSCGLIADMLADPRLRLRLVGSATASDRLGLESSIGEHEPRLCSLPSFPVDELGIEAATTLVRAANADLSERDARRLFRAVGGIPGYLISAAAASVAGGGLPDSIREIAEQHLAMLPGPDRLLCSVLAVNGVPTDVQVLAAVLEAPLHVVSAAVARLGDRSILRRQEAGVWFTQTFLATAAYGSLSEGEQTEFHRRFLAIQQGHSNPSASSLRRHSLATGSGTESLYRALVQEAESAESLGAVREASHLWNGARSAADSVEDEGHAAIRQTDVLVRMREYDRAAEIVDGFLATNEAPASLTSRLELRALIIRSQADPGGVETADARRVVQRLETEGTSLDLAVGLETALRIADARGDPTFGREMLQVAEGATPSDPEAATWLHLACTRHLYLGDPERGLFSARQAVVQADLAGRPGPLARALNRLIVALVFRGKLASSEGSSVLSRARSVAQEFGDTLLMYDTYVNEGSWHMDTGDLDAADEAFSTARSLLGGEMSRAEILTTRVNRGELLLHQRRGPEALGEFRSALEYAEGESTGALLCAAGMTLASLETGRLSKAREWAAHLKTVDPSDRYRGNVSLVALAMARLALAEGKPQRALETLLLFADQMMLWMVPAALKLYLEAFRLARRIKAPLGRDRVLPVVSAVRELGIPGHGLRILRFQDQP